MVYIGKLYAENWAAFLFSSFFMNFIILKYINNFNLHVSIFLY